MSSIVHMIAWGLVNVNDERDSNRRKNMFRAIRAELEGHALRFDVGGSSSQQRYTVRPAVGPGYYFSSGDLMKICRDTLAKIDPTNYPDPNLYPRVST